MQREERQVSECLEPRYGLGSFLFILPPVLALHSLRLLSCINEHTCTMKKTSWSVERLTPTILLNNLQIWRRNALTVSALDAAPKANTILAKVVAWIAGTDRKTRDLVNNLTLTDVIHQHSSILLMNAVAGLAPAGEHGSVFAILVSDAQSLAPCTGNYPTEVYELIGDSLNQIQLSNQRPELRISFSCKSIKIVGLRITLTKLAIPARTY